MSYRWSDPEVREGDIASLRNTPFVLRAMFRDRPDAWLDARHGEDSLSPRETIPHLLYSETDNWMPRIRHILMVGDQAPFAPLAMDDPDGPYARLTLEAQLAEFESLRLKNVDELLALNISEADLGKTSIHPKLGVVQLDQQISTWVAHDLYHCGQIFKAFGSGFQGAIGPWQAFLNLPHFN